MHSSRSGEWFVEKDVVQCLQQFHFFQIQNLNNPLREHA